MTPTIADELANARSLAEARSAVQGLDPEEGAIALFTTVRESIGSDPDRARRLAAWWRVFATHRDAVSTSYRIRAVRDRLDGQWLKSVDSFQKAAQASKDSVEAATVQIGAVDSLGRAGRVDAAVKLGKKLVRILDTGNQRHLAGLVLLNMGNASLWHDRYVPATRYLTQALERIDAEDRLHRASALLGLSTGLLFGGSPRLALEAAEASQREFSDLGLDQYEALALSNMAQALMLSGRLDEALDIFVSNRERLASPLEQLRNEEFLGDLYVRLNRPIDAEDAYRQALESPVIGSAPLNRANATYGLAMAELGLGKTVQSLELFTRAQRLYTAFGNKTWMAACLIGKSRALAARADDKRAVRAAASAVSLLSQSGSPRLLAESRLQLASCVVANKARASIELSAVSRLLHRVRDPRLVWKFHYLRAKVDAHSALTHYRRMARSIWASRALVSSEFARFSFFADKSEAMADYLVFLLETGRESRTREALDVVRSMRSVSLLDEIFRQRRNVPPAVLDRLAELRQQLSAMGDDVASPGDVRRMGQLSSSVLRLERSWNEVVRQSVSWAVGPPTTVTTVDKVFVEGPLATYVLDQGRATRLGATTSEIQSAVRWTRFEILRQMSNPGGSPDSALRALDRLSSLLSFEPGGRPRTTVCPDGCLWQAPWAALAALHGTCEAVLSLGPWSPHEGVRLPKHPKTVLWYFAGPDLPHIEVEARQFMRMFPEAKVCRTLEEARESLDGHEVDLLHVAAHARFQPSNPMFSAVALRDGWLTAAEIARSRLRASLVTLSACETGSLSVRMPNEPEGLARAFLALGASSVLASSWSLHDEAASNFMYHYYLNLGDGASVVHAVQKARTELRGKFPHPYYWGAFTLFGGYST